MLSSKICLLIGLLAASSAFALSTDEKIKQLSDRVGQLSVQIRTAHNNQERLKAAQLRDEREQIQRELQELRNKQREEKAAAEREAQRLAVEKTWESFPPQKRLCAAIEYNRLDLVEKSLAGNQVDLQKPNEYCFFPLGDAAERGHAEIVEYLLQQKSPLALYSPAQRHTISAIEYAARSKRDRTSILKLLKSHGATATINESDSDNESTTVTVQGTVLTRTLETGHPKNIRWLLREGVNPNAAIPGRTALMIAIDSNDPDKVGLLIQAGADVNLRVSPQQTPLDYAEKRHATVRGKKKAEMDDIIAQLKNAGAVKAANLPR